MALGEREADRPGCRARRRPPTTRAASTCTATSSRSKVAMAGPARARRCRRGGGRPRPSAHAAPSEPGAPRRREGARACRRAAASPPVETRPPPAPRRGRNRPAPAKPARLPRPSASLRAGRGAGSPVLGRADHRQRARPERSFGEHAATCSAATSAEYRQLGHPPQVDDEDLISTNGRSPRRSSTARPCARLARRLHPQRCENLDVPAAVGGTATISHVFVLR